MLTTELVCLTLREGEGHLREMAKDVSRVRRLETASFGEDGVAEEGVRVKTQLVAAQLPGRRQRPQLIAALPVTREQPRPAAVLLIPRVQAESRSRVANFSQDLPIGRDRRLRENLLLGRKAKDLLEVPTEGPALEILS